MTAGKRVLLAFCCLLLGFGLFALWGFLPTAIRYGAKYALPTLEILPAYFVVALLGFVLALPFVLLLKNAEGWRAWVTLALGIGLGPTFLSTWAIASSDGHFSSQGDGVALLMSLWIAVPTTVSYILLLRRFTKRL